MKSENTPSDSIELYLLQIRNKLQGLPSVQISEILAELRSHILDSINSRHEAITDVLNRLGSPDNIAAMYLMEDLMAQAETSRSPWLVMRTLFRLAIKSVWALAAFLVSFLGYGTAVGFLVCAIAKPFYPDHVGLWWDTKSHIPTGLGFVWPAPSDRELLGRWIIPLGLTISAVLFVVTTHFARWNIQRIRRTRRTSQALAPQQSTS